MVVEVVAARYQGLGFWQPNAETQSSVRGIRRRFGEQRFDVIQEVAQHDLVGVIGSIPAGRHRRDLDSQFWMLRLGVSHSISPDRR